MNHFVGGAKIDKANGKISLIPHTVNCVGVDTHCDYYCRIPAALTLYVYVEI